ncbi:phosphoribosylamine-glycine ligase [Apiospora arundinis]
MVVGKGSREHGLVWRLAHSPPVSRNIVLPRDAGTEETAKTQNAVSIKANDNPKIVSFARENGVNLVVGGVEEQFLGSYGRPSAQETSASCTARCRKPGSSRTALTRRALFELGELASGSAGIPFFAPSRAAAEIEGSKAYAKQFMSRYIIPTTTGEGFDFYSQARKYIKGELWTRYTAGGRVFSATALGETLEEAFKAACEGVKLIKFDGMHYRKGIASK